MQRLLNNLLTVAVIGLVSTSASLVMAHGAGGGGGHGSTAAHGSSGHSGSSHGGTNRSAMHKSTSHPGSSHKPLAHASHKQQSSGKPTGSKPKKTTKLAANGTHHEHHAGYRHGDHLRWHDHLRYPVGFWFDSSYDWADGDVADADAVPGGIDVEFTKIQQIDAGDPAKNLAPAYRVWFHNNSDVDIAQPFDVAILASSDDQLAQNLPYSSVRVDSLAADETTSVDIRLPVNAMSMATDDGQTAPFAYVHTIIDAQKELVETNKANNLSVDSRDDIPAVEAE